MKMLFLVLSIVLSVEAMAQAKNYVDATGAVKTREAEFSTVINSASSALTAGEAVCLDLTADDGISVDFCTTNGMPLGVIVDTSCAVGARCKLLKRGYYSVAVLDVTQGNATAGEAAYAHTDGSVYGDLSDDGKHPLGVFLDSSAASGTIEIFVKP